MSFPTQYYLAGQVPQSQSFYLATIQTGSNAGLYYLAVNDAGSVVLDPTGPESISNGDFGQGFALLTATPQSGGGYTFSYPTTGTINSLGVVNGVLTGGATATTLFPVTTQANNIPLFLTGVYYSFETADGTPVKIPAYGPLPPVEDGFPTNIDLLFNFFTEFYVLPNLYFIVSQGTCDESITGVNVPNNDALYYLNNPSNPPLQGVTLQSLCNVPSFSYCSVGQNCGSCYGPCGDITQTCNPDPQGSINFTCGVPVGPPATPWYQRWYVIAGILFIVLIIILIVVLSRKNK